MIVVREGETSFLSLSFFDEDEEEVIPDSGSYTIKDMDTGNVLVDETDFIPVDSTYTIEIDSTTNTFVDSDKDTEHRLVLVNYIYDLNKEVEEEILYILFRKVETDTNNLCTVAEVKLFGRLDNDTLSDDEITLLINFKSDLIRLDAEDNSLTSDNVLAKMCCIYGVLSEMEDKNMINTINEGTGGGSRTVSSYSDGDFSISFESEGTYDRNDGQSLPKSNSGKYEFYLSKLMQNPFDYECTDEMDWI